MTDIMQAIATILFALVAMRMSQRITRLERRLSQLQRQTDLKELRDNGYGPCEVSENLKQHHKRDL